MDTNLYYILATALTLVGAIFACIQLWQIKVNRKKQFDQDRREQTVKMVIFYTKSITDETKYAESIVSSFSEDQCRELYNCGVLVVNKDTKEKICTICPHKEECKKLKDNRCRKKETSFIIQDDVLYHLRGHIIKYLNSLESVLLSWQLGIVDQEVIEEQFAFLNKKSEREKALGIFRKIAGNGHSYPAIEKFYQHLEQKEREEAQKSLKKILK